MSIVLYSSQINFRRSEPAPGPAAAAGDAVNPSL